MVPQVMQPLYGYQQQQAPQGYQQQQQQQQQAPPQGYPQQPQTPQGYPQQPQMPQGYSHQSQGSYAAQPMQQPMQQQQQQQQQGYIPQSGLKRRGWTYGLCDPCPAGVGCGNFCCAFLFPFCAAGSVAEAAGKSYCVSCFVIPQFLPCCIPCFWNSDRSALAKSLSIEDDMDSCNACVCMTVCPILMLTQELNEMSNGSRGSGEYLAVPGQQPPPQYYSGQQQPQQGYGATNGASK